MFKSKTECLNVFFSFLNDSKVAYCVLGDTRSLPTFVSSDIDIVVSRQDFRYVENAVQDFATKYNCYLVQVLHHEVTASYFVLSFLVGDGKVSYVHPDICSDYSIKNKIFLTADQMLLERKLAVNEKGEDKLFYVCSPDIEFTYYLLKKIEKNTLSILQFEHLREQHSKMPERCRLVLADYFSHSDVDNIINFVRSGNLELLIASLPHLKSYLSENTEIRFKDYRREVLRSISRVINPTGVVIAFLGPDGAGKTAIGERLEHDLAPAFRGVRRYHLRPNILGRNSKVSSIVTNPHGQKRRGILASIAKLVYFIIDFSLGYVKQIGLLKVKSNLILFDRYFHDLMIDPKRYRYGGPMWLIKIGSFLVLKPDLFLVFDAPTSAIQARKREVGFEETERQRQAYLAFAKKQPNCIVIDTSSNIDESVKAASKAVLAYMQARQSKRSKRHAD